MIRLDHFEGMVPRQNPGSLPDFAAQQAQNCDLTGGVLVPLNATGPFSALHDGTSLNAGVPVADVIQITKPNAPTVAAITKNCQPWSWFRIWVNDWVSVVNTGTGETDVTNVRSHAMPILNVEYTETGLNILSYLFQVTYTFALGGPYFLRGPKYRFQFTADPGGVYGGPDVSQTFPVVATEGDEEFPRQRIPLVDRNENVYAFWQCTDIFGPNYDEDYLVEDYANVFVYHPSTSLGYVNFTINLNYVIPQRRHFYYVQTALTAADQEGPPSEVSDKVTLRPGERLLLDTPLPSGFTKNRLYRSTTGGDDFRLLGDVNANQVFQDRTETQTDVIPPYGNYPTTVSVDEFLRGSSIHPAHYAVAFDNVDGKGTLYVSDSYRFHAWPDENTVPFEDEIQAITMVGGTTLVFVGDAVYGCSGNNPSALSKVLISETMPLRNPLSLCRIGQTAFWATDDGLAASNGGTVQIISAQHFTRGQWAFFQPTEMVCKTADGAVFIETTTLGTVPENLPWAVAGQSLNLRFDVDEQLKAVSVYTAETGGTMLWRSKRFYFQEPTVFDWVRVEADDYTNLTMTVYADRTQVTTLAIEDNQPHLINLSIASDGGDGFGGGIGAVAPGGPAAGTGTLPHAREWSFEVQNNATVRSIEAYDRQIVTVADDAVTLNAGNTPLWQAAWLKFPDSDKFCGGILSAQTSASIPVRLYADGVLVWNGEVTGGRFFAIPRTVPKGTLWRVEVDTEHRVDELVLFRRQTESVRDDLREVYGGGVPPWLVKRYEFVDQAQPRSVVVHATSGLLMNLYFDGATSPSQTVTVADNAEIALTDATFSSLEFAFSGSDANVTEVLFYASDTKPVGGDGLFLTGLDSWRNMKYAFADRGRFVCASVAVDDYDDVTLTLTADGVEVYSEPVTDGHAFTLPRTISDAKFWIIDIATSANVYQAMFLPLRPEPVDRAIEIVNPRQVPPWMFTRYEFPRTTKVISVRTECSQSVRMRLYLDGSTTATAEKVIPASQETLLDVSATCGAIEFDFNKQDYLVTRVGVYAEETIPVGPEGVMLGSRPNWRMLKFKFPDKGRFVVGSLDVQNYDDVDIEIRSGTRKVYDESISDGELIRLPRGLTKNAVWTVDVKTAAEVRGLTLLPVMPVAAPLGVRETNTEVIPPWLYRRYEFGSPQELQSVKIEADTYPVTMQVFFDGASGSSYQQTVTGAHEYGLAPTDLCSAVELWFEDDDQNVRDVTLLTHQTQIIGDTGVQMQNPPSTRGVQVRFTDAGSWACGQIGLSSYTGTKTLTLTKKGPPDNGYAQSVTDDGVFSFTRTMVRGSLWELDMNTTARVNSIVLMPWQRASIGPDPLRLTRPETGLAPWLHTRWDVPDTMRVKSAVVHASSYPVNMRLFLDDAQTVTETVVIRDNRELRLNIARCSSFDFDFDGDDNTVTEVILYPRTYQLIGDGPVLAAGGSWRGLLYRFADTSAFAAMSVGMDTANGTVAITVYANGTKVYEATVPSGTVLLPLTLANAGLWEVDCVPEGSARIESLVLYPWRREQASGTIHSITQPGAVPPWTYTKYEFTAPTTIRSGLVKGIGSQALRLYADDSYSAHACVVGFEDRTEFAFTTPTTFKTLVARTTVTDQGHELWLFGEETLPVENQGVVLRQASGNPAWLNKILRFAETGSWSVARVVASNYTGLVLKLRTLGSSAWNTWTVTDSAEFKLDFNTAWVDLDNARDWELAVEHDGDIQEIHLFARETVPVDADAVVIRRNGGPYTWLDKRVRADQPVSWGVCRVVADQYPVTVRIYTNDDHLVYEGLALDATGFRLTRLPRHREWRVDLEAESGTQIRELVLARSMEGLRRIG